MSSYQRSFVKSIFLVGLTSLILTACQSHTGQGEIRLTSGAVNGLEEYMNLSNPTAFAAAIDGSTYSYYFCSEVNCKNTTSSYHKAVVLCESRGPVECKLLATNKDVVWRKSEDEAYTLFEIKAMNQGVDPTPGRSLSNKELCSKATTDNPAKWAQEFSMRPYVKEALLRKLSPETCTQGSN
ncbi:MAG: hypothetical protein OQK24_00625 [Magnetovibrio sp.]|nr:hypothetical protein [Magnetovibrio sp.]